MLKRSAFGLKTERGRLLILLLAIAVCVASALYFVLIRGITAVHTHIFYVPIILSGIWYYKKAVYVALFLSMVYLLAIHFSPTFLYIGAVARAVVFIAVAYIVGYISEKRAEEKSLRKRTEQIIRHQTALLELTKLDYSDPDSVLKGITEMDSKTLGVERVSVWLFTEDHSEIVCEDLYKLSETLHEKGLRFEAYDSPRYFQALEDGRAIAVNDACTDPRTSELSDVYFNPHGITSIMDVPVRLHGKFVGIVCHEHLGSRREWTPEEEDFAASIADIVSLALEGSERKRAEEKLRRETRFSNILVQASPAFFVAIGSNGKTRMMNDAMLDTLGYTLDEVVGRDYLATFVPESDRTMLSRIFEKLTKSNKPTLNENRILTRDGRELLVEWHGRSIFKENSEFDFFFGLGIDITERKQAEEELQEAHDTLEIRVEERTTELSRVNEALQVKITEQKRAEESLRKRSEQIIRHQTTLLKLTKLDYSDLDPTLKRITEMASKTLGVERISIWLFTEDRSAIICEDLYKLSENLHEKELRLQAYNYPRYFQALKGSRAIAANDAYTDSRTNELSDGYLKPHSITSMMDIPIRLHGKLVGTVCHEHVGPRREWTMEEQDFAASISDIVSLTLESSERKRAEETLKRAHSELERRVKERTSELVEANKKLKQTQR